MRKTISHEAREDTKLSMTPEDTRIRILKEKVTLRHYLLVCGLVLAWTGILSISYATRSYENYQEKGIDSLWIDHLWPSLTFYCPWALLSFLIVILSRRFPFSRGIWPLSVLVHIMASALFGAAKWLIEGFLRKSIFDLDSEALTAGTLTFECAMYFTILIGYNGLGFYNRYQERKLKASQLEAQLAQAQLKLMKMQLNPHFLFNTLNAVSTLVHDDAEAADRMITRLSDLLRLSLENTGAQEVPLKQELDFLKRYLDIEQIRFGDRLQVDMDIAPDAMEAYVPNLLLQPIVENAVNHGVSRIVSIGRIVLRAIVKEGVLYLEVSDNGPGLSGRDVGSIARVGLANTMARMTQLYGAQGSIGFVTPKEGGLLVRMSVPYHTVPVSGSPMP
jgi:two-component system LytT family sensor kinase